MTGPAIRLNPSIDPHAYAETYRHDGMVQITDFLHPDSANWLYDTLRTATPWSLALSSKEGGKLLSPQELRSLGHAGLSPMVQDVLAQAASGFAFVYLSYAIIPALLAGDEPGHATHAFVEFANSPEFIAFGKAVTGEDTITKIDAQATWFRPGDFLNLHNDTGVGERRAAYTLGLSRDWRADWGGQLLFHDKAGDVTRGFKPGFNVWTLFRTPQWHSVAPVAAYATQRRLSITGWLRDDPPFKAGANGPPA